MKLQTKHIDSLSLVFLSVLLGLGFFGIYIHYADSQHKLYLKHDLLAKQKNDLDRARNSVEQLKDVLESHKATLKELNQRIPSTAGIGTLLEEIHDRIHEHRVSMPRFDHEHPVQFGQYQRIPLHITLEGNFLDIYQLLHALETMNRLFIIDSVHMTQPDGQTVCQTELTASIYFD